MKKWIAAAAIAIPSVTLATLQQQPDTSSGLTLPPGWEKMEIEAKWDIDKAQYDALVKGHPDNGAKLGYDLNVRWGGLETIHRLLLRFARTHACKVAAFDPTPYTLDIRPSGAQQRVRRAGKGQLGRGLAANPVQEHTDSDRSRLVSGRNR